MQRWRSAVVLTIAACTSRKEEPAASPAVVEPRMAEPAAVAVEPTPDAPAPGVLPLECQRYRTMVAGLGTCSSLPSHVRDAQLRTFFDLENTWSTLAPAALETIAGRCAAASDALAQAVGACPAVAEVPPVTSSGSRDVPSERGVPLDQATLGPLPHPFGALEFLRPGISRDEILSALPNARRDGEDKIIVPVGVEELIAEIAIDYTGHLDVVNLKVTATARAMLVKAWGPPTPTGTWFDRRRRWRADLDGELLVIGPFVPLAELVGKGPDGLAETQAVIGATPAQLTQRFGDRIEERDVTDDDGQATGAKGYALLLPATEVCRYYTTFHLDLVGGRVAKATLHQCFDDDAGRRAALAALESRWGRATPARGADDRPVFTFHVPGRRVEATVDDSPDHITAWNLVITAR